VGGGLYGSRSVRTTDKETRNVSSGIAAGGQLALVNNKNVTIQGSNVSADKGGLIQATNDVNIVAGADTSEVTSHKETSCILCVSSSSTGTTSAGASAFAKKTGAGGEVSAQAQASAEGKNSSSLNFYSKTVTDSQAKKSDSVASNVTFGDKGAIVAGNTLTIQGSNVATTAGDLVLKGKDVNILSGENTETSTTTSKTTSVGIFVDLQGKASAEAKAGAIGAVAGKDGKAALAAGGNASAKASAEGSSTVTIGARVTSSKDTTDKLTNVGSQISSGGNLVIVADNDITTRGANLSAAGKLVDPQPTSTIWRRPITTSPRRAAARRLPDFTSRPAARPRPRLGSKVRCSFRRTRSPHKPAARAARPSSGPPPGSRSRLMRARGSASPTIAKLGRGQHARGHHHAVSRHGRRPRGEERD
jgi:hypothetical protein